MEETDGRADECTPAPSRLCVASLPPVSPSPLWASIYHARLDLLTRCPKGMLCFHNGSLELSNYTVKVSGYLRLNFQNYMGLWKSSYPVPYSRELPPSLILWPLGTLHR